MEQIRKHNRNTSNLEFSLETTFAQLGIDSVGAVNLLMELESTFDTVFPDEHLTIETFYSVGSLWSVLSSLVAVS
jgi:acyl carrier protein